jgi:hypothetical protein
MADVLPGAAPRYQDSVAQDPRFPAATAAVDCTLIIAVETRLHAGVHYFSAQKLLGI